jgi:hypothetical protein
VRKPGADAGPTVGVYRCRIGESDGRTHKFRLLLWAELPDRFHGEVIHPLGGTELIIDGDGERLLVAVIRERLAFVGPPAADVMRQVIGVDLPPQELVQVLLTGRGARDDYRAERQGGPGPGLPERFEIERDGRRLTLQLRRLDALRADPDELATGEPPEGFEVHPLADLHWEWSDDTTG